jgi:hypothetical protein
MIRKASLVPILLLICFAFKPFDTSARQYNSLFWMKGIPQSNYGNPALAPQPNFFIGLPLLSSLSINMSNRGFMINDVLRLDMYDEYYWDNDHFLNQLEPNNHFQGSFHVDLLSFGLRHKDSYFFFHVADRVEMNVGYTADMAHLLVKGSDAYPSNMLPGDFIGLGTDYHHYREYAASYSRDWSPAITTGIRGKVLAGLAHTAVDYQSMHLQTDPSDGKKKLYADILIHSSNTSIPQILKGEESGDGHFDNSSHAIDYLTNSNNLGAAIDLGMIIRPTPSLHLGFSVLDIGFIDWKDQAESVEITGSSNFIGINLQDMFEGVFAENFIKHADTTSYGFDLTARDGSYRQILSPRVMASAAYDLSQRHQLALLTQGFYYNDKLYPSASISYYARPSHAFGIIMSYTVANMNYSNIGLGFNLNLGPIQLYAVSDNVLAAIQPYKTQLATLHLGMNLVFGYRPQSGRPLHGW